MRYFLENLLKVSVCSSKEPYLPQVRRFVDEYGSFSVCLTSYFLMLLLCLTLELRTRHTIFDNSDMAKLLYFVYSWWLLTVNTLRVEPSPFLSQCTCLNILEIPTDGNLRRLTKKKLLSRFINSTRTRTIDFGFDLHWQMPNLLQSPWVFRKPNCSKRREPLIHRYRI